MSRWAALTVLASVGCAAGQGSPCHGAGCPSGLECLAHRCVPQGSLPVPTTSHRVLLMPTRMAVVTESRGSGGLPPIVALGARADGDTRWFVAYDGSWKRGGDIESAFLLLDPAPGEGSPDDIELTVWTVHDAWQSGTLRWRRVPTFGHPRAHGLARSRPGAPLRIDVTPLAKRIAASKDDNGFVLVADETPGHGAPYWTGVGGGLPPRLEVYLR